MTSRLQRAEEALRESEERYRVFMDASADLAFLKDDAFRHVMVNGRYAAFFGRSVDEVLGKTDYDLMPAPVAEVCRRSDAEALAQGTVVEGEEQVGETIFQTRKFPVPLRGGRVGVGGFIRDVTDQRRAEAALAQERFLLRALMDHVPDSVYFKDRDSRIIRISSAQARLFGVSDAAEAVGRTDFDFFTEEHARQAFDDEQAILRTERPVTKEERETWAGRPDTWVSTTKVPLRDEAGRVVGTFGISRDITERRQAEEALRTSLSLVEATLESTDNGILVIGREGAVVRANHRFAELWRIPSEVLASGQDRVLLNYVLGQLAEPDAFIAKVEELYGAPRAESLDVIRLRDGRVFERVSRPMLVAGEPLARVWSFRDITERKRAEEEREQLIRGLQDALAKVKTLSGLLPICASCKRIRDDSGYWNQLERYVAEHSEAVFSHDICPECMRKLYPDLLEEGDATG